jgi:hypothetical protein
MATALGGGVIVVAWVDCPRLFVQAPQGRCRRHILDLALLDCGEDLQEGLVLVFCIDGLKNGPAAILIPRLISKSIRVDNVVGLLSQPLYLSVRAGIVRRNA